jgi:excisionase family DNA binding protein
MKAYLNASEVAKLLKVDRATVGRWLKKGLVRGAIRPSEGHQWRIPLAAYEKLVKDEKQNESR